MRALLLGVVATFVLTTAVHADDAQNRKDAEKHFRIAEKAYKLQNFGAAADHFEEAYKLLPLPEIAFSAAQAYRRQYRVEHDTAKRLALAQRSVHLYKAYLAEMKTGGRVGDAADYLDRMEHEVELLTAAGAKSTTTAVAAERTTIVINPQLASESSSELLTEVADRPDADEAAPKMTVLLDDKPVAPYEKIDVAPGPHKIHVEAEGYVPADGTERAVKDLSVIANLTLTPQPARVSVETEHGARIRVDGRYVANAPALPIEVAAGRHVIGISRAGRESITREITVARGQALTVHESLGKTTQRKLVPWVAGVAGALTVFTGVSIGLAIVADNAAADKLDTFRATGDRLPEEAADYRDLVEQRSKFKNGAYIGGSAALGVAALAAAMYWFDKPSDEGVHVAPTASATGAGVTLGGRF